ncbi:restriction endonuclease subunit S [Salmonella enterica subsp. enterica serovar Falkensee]|nr:restriction endonuclease subunit S [Salmonella enterica]
MSWPMISLGELVDIKGGGTPDKNNSEYWNGDIPWASVKDFKKNILDSTLDSITLLGVRNSATSVIPAGNIIVPTRMALGKVAINTIDLAINQDLKALFIKDNDVVDRDYLFRWLESQSSLIESEGKGATVKGITLPFLKGLNVPIPPINEQKRIAAILDKAEDIRQKREQAIKLADDFLRATFMKMFGTPAQNIHNFPKGTIRDLIDSVNYGTSAKASVDSGEYPVLRMGNITYQGGWDFTDFKYLDLSEKDKDKFLVQKGDLLFNRTNSKELVGKTAIYEEDRPMAFAGYLIRVRPNLNGNNYYLSGCLNSTYGKTTLVNMCKSIVGMANINAQELQDIEILIPPKHLQDEYENIYKKVKMGLAIFDRSAWQVQQLAANLMNKYFM